MVFQKFMNFFFEEVEDDEEVEEIEEVEEPRYLKNKKSSTTTVTRTEVEEPTKTTMQDITLESTTTNVDKQFIRNEESSSMEFYKVAEKPSTFIDIDEPVIPQETPAPVRREIPQRKVEINDRRGVNYDFKTVISPIFGVTEKEAEISNSNDVTEHKTTRRSESYLGTVFSPMYGMNKHVKEAEKEEVKVEEKKDNVEALNITVHNELPPLCDIDDIISTPKHNDKKEDIHQYSFFDEDFKEEVKEDLIDELEISEFFDNSNK